jgi:hypothetical protein
MARSPTETIKNSFEYYDKLYFQRKITLLLIKMGVV